MLLRLAGIEVDPARLQADLAALREGIAASLREERGVLALQAVSLRGSPASIRLLEADPVLLALRPGFPADPG